MTNAEVNEIAGKLMELNQLVKEEEYRYTKKRDFENIKENAKVHEAIATLLQYLDKIS